MKRQDVFSNDEYRAKMAEYHNDIAKSMMLDARCENLRRINRYEQKIQQYSAACARIKDLAAIAMDALPAYPDLELVERTETVRLEAFRIHQAERMVAAFAAKNPGKPVILASPDLRKLIALEVDDPALPVAIAQGEEAYTYASGVVAHRNYLSALESLSGIL